MIQQNPNITVWSAAKDYLESADILFRENKFNSAVVLCALSIELSLKSFLAERVAPWTANTEHGHSFLDLYEAINIEDRNDLEILLNDIDNELKLKKIKRIR